MSNAKLHTFADEIPDASLEETFGEPVEQTPEGDWLDDMQAEYDSMLVEIVDLKLPWPFWKGNLTATFGLLDEKASDELRATIRGAQGSKTQKGRQMMCNFLAESCTSLEYKGRRLDEGKGFGVNAARALRAPKGASQGDLVWLATKEDSEVLAKFALKVLKWSEDPVKEDRTEDVNGPFVSE